jgi:hypothetical protein
MSFLSRLPTPASSRSSSFLGCWTQEVRISKRTGCLFAGTAVLVTARTRLFSTTTRQFREAPLSNQGPSKVFGSADDAIADLKDGSVVLSAGFGLSGVAGKLVRPVITPQAMSLEVAPLTVTRNADRRHPSQRHPEPDSRFQQRGRRFPWPCQTVSHRPSDTLDRVIYRQQ